MSKITAEDLKWPQLTRTGYVTGAYWSLGTTPSQVAVKSAAFIARLRALSLEYSCELCLNIHENAGGTLEYIALTTLTVAQVSASAASYARNCRDFIVTVRAVKLPVPDAENISVATLTRLTSRV